jgi:photosystem II stability/assembly factor-like uncharacterized protein
MNIFGLQNSLHVPKYIFSHKILWLLSSIFFLSLHNGCKKNDPVSSEEMKSETPPLLWLKTGNDYLWVTKIQFNYDKLFISTDGDGFYYSMDNAQTLHTLSIPGNSSVYDFEISGNTIFTAPQYENQDHGNLLGGYSTVFKSSDNGYSFSEKDIGDFLFANDFAVEHKPNYSGSIVYMATGNGLRYTSDWGGTWERMDSISTMPKDYFSFLDKVEVLDSTIFIQTHYGSKILATTDRGRSWIKLNATNDEYKYEYILLAHENKLLLQSYNAVFISEDNGSTFTKLQQPISDYSVNTLQTAYYKDSVMYCASYYGIHLTKDFGKSWKTIKPQFPDNYGKTIVSLTVRSDTLFAGTKYNGIWKLPIKQYLNF